MKQDPSSILSALQACLTSMGAPPNIRDFTSEQADRLYALWEELSDLQQEVACGPASNHDVKAPGRPIATRRRALSALDFESLFRKAEKAVDAHPLLCGGERGGGYYPRIDVNRLGFNFVMTAKRKGSRKRATDITAEGDTPEEAVEKLLGSLDYWAEAMK